MANAPVLKTGAPKGLVGSSPTPSVSSQAVIDQIVAEAPLERGSP